MLWIRTRGSFWFSSVDSANVTRWVNRKSVQSRLRIAFKKKVSCDLSIILSVKTVGFFFQPTNPASLLHLVAFWWVPVSFLWLVCVWKVAGGRLGGFQQPRTGYRWRLSMTSPSDCVTLLLEQFVCRDISTQHVTHRRIDCSVGREFAHEQRCSRGTFVSKRHPYIHDPMDQLGGTNLIGVLWDTHTSSYLLHWRWSVADEHRVWNRCEMEMIKQRMCISNK